jgi:hypothetical protein
MLCRISDIFSEPIAGSRVSAAMAGYVGKPSKAQLRDAHLAEMERAIEKSFEVIDRAKAEMERSRGLLGTIARLRAVFRASRRGIS